MIQEQILTTNIEDNSELDKELLELHQKYAEMKKDRIKSQKDELLLSNKMKLLAQEEKKIQRRLETDSRFQENIEQIRVSVLKNKEMVEEAKRLKELDQEEKKLKNSKTKTEIRESLSNWRINVTNKNKDKVKQIKQEKAENEKLIQMYKDEKKSKNQYLHDRIQTEAMFHEEKKKKEEIDKKMKMKQELENKIKWEIEKKNKLDTNINKYQENSIKIVQRLNTMDLRGDNTTVSQKVSTGGIPKPQTEKKVKPNKMKSDSSSGKNNVKKKGMVNSNSSVSSNKINKKKIENNANDKKDPKRKLGKEYSV